MGTITEYAFRPYAEALRGAYRKSLLKFGMSTNSPISSLTKEELLSFQDSPERRFLLDMSEYYATLDPFERRVLVSEALERGLHYLFWYVSSLSDRDYRRLRKRVCEPVFLDAKKEGLL